MLAHWSSRKEFFSPFVRDFGMNANAPVIAVTIGEYYWAAHNYWQWKATREGKALATLQEQK